MPKVGSKMSEPRTSQTSASELAERAGGRAESWWAVFAVAFVLAGAIGCAAGSKSAKKTESSEELPEPTDRESSSEEAADGEEASGSAKKPVSGPAKKRIQRAVEISEKGNLDRASNVLTKLLDDSESGFLAAYNLGAIAEQKGNPGGAAKRYNQALEKNPDFTPALMNLVRLYIRQGRVGDASEIADRYIEQRPENLDHRSAKLEVLLARKQYDTVIQKAKELLRRDERNVGAMIAMAKANYWMERYELSEAILNRAEELDPDRADIYFVFGLIAMENEESSRAISNFEKALEQNPRFAEAHNNLGLLYHDAGDFPGAAEQFQEAIADYPGFREAKLNLGIAYKQLGEFEKAEAQFKEVIEMDSDSADAYFNLGVLYLDSEIPGMDKIPRLEQSIETLNKYKSVAGGKLSEDDPANNYIEAAREKIKAEKEREEMMRQQQQGADSSSEGEGGGDESNDESNDE